MKALIQKVKGQFPNLNFFNADKGFTELGYEIQYYAWHKSFGFVAENGRSIDKLRHEDVIVGGIPVIDDALEKLRVVNPYLPSYPKALEFYLERAVGEVTIGTARDRIVEGGAPLFIKPKDEARKLFNGCVLSEFKDLIPTAGIPHETVVIYSELIDFVSEWRVFIRKNRVVGIKNYRGSIRHFPCFDTIDGMVDAYSAEAPVAYALDVGIIQRHDREWTALVEVNDATALGCYGLHPTIYAGMIADRWDEIMDITTVGVA